MNKIIKAYYLFFYKLYRLFMSISNDGWENWKAFLVVCVLQGYLFYAIYIWIRIAIKSDTIYICKFRINRPHLTAKN